MKTIKLGVVILLAGSISACGGGGGGGSSASVTNQSSTFSRVSAGQIIERITKYFSDGTQTSTTSAVEITGVPSVAPDHVSVTGMFRTSGGTGRTTLIIEPSLLTAPTVSPAIYPDRWATGSPVTAPHVSSVSGTYFDGTPYYADGSQTAPFRQATLAPNGPRGAEAINDPNASVVSPTKGTYDLHWGTPDVEGPAYIRKWYGANGDAKSYTFPSSIMIAGRNVSGQSSASSGMTLGVPVADVKAAWAAGWTGFGQNVLMVDGYPNPDNSQKPSSWTADKYKSWYTHGITTYLLAQRYAPGANFYLFDGNFLFDDLVHRPSDNSVPLLQTTTRGTLATTSRVNPGFYFDVINISLGYNYWENNITNPTPVQVQAAFDSQSNWTNFISRTLDGTDIYRVGAVGSVTTYLTDAVVTKSAGNDSITSEKDPLNKVLADNGQVSPRLLIVGALNAAGVASSGGGAGTGTIANYSNIAGTDLNLQNRFLLASGGAPYSDTGIAISGNAVPGGRGTSYAAPRVAGYVAIVRQKFPNLTGANTADILLATARYDTLACYPHCDKAVYGQGEASLSRALAPVGYLR